MARKSAASARRSAAKTGGHLPPLGLDGFDGGPRPRPSAAGAFPLDNEPDRARSGAATPPEAALLESTGMTILRLDPDGRVLAAVPPAGLFGEAVGQPLAAYVHPADRCRLDRVRAIASAPHGSRISATFRFGYAGTGWRRIAATATNLLDDPGVAAVAVACLPIEDMPPETTDGAAGGTTSPPSTAALPVVTFSTRPGDPLRLAYLSPRIEPLAGYHPREFVDGNQPWSTVIHADDRARFEQALAQAAAAGDEAVSIVYRIVDRAGAARWIRDDRLRATDNVGVWHGVLIDASAWQAANTDLRRAEERSRRLLELLPAAVYIQETARDRQELNYFVNERLEEMLGFTPEEWADDAFWVRHLHPDDRNRVLAAEEVSDGWLGPFCQDYRIRARDGRTVWMRDEARLLDVTADGRQRWLGVMVDITETMRADEALRASERRFRALVQQSHDIIAVFNRDGTLQYVTPSIQPLLGHDPDALGADAARSLLHPDDLPLLEQAIAACVRSGGRSDPIVVRVRHRDGAWRTFEAIGTNLLAEPEVAGIVFNARDVTERQAIERSLRESERRFQRFMAILPAPAAIKDRHGRFLFANEPFQRMMGATTDRAGSLSEAGRRVLLTGEAIEQTETVVGADGVERHLLTIRFPIDLDDDRLVGFAALDITERKRADEAQRLLAAIVTAADDAIVARDPNGTIVSWNPGAERLFGYPAEEMIGRPVEILIPPSRRAEHEAATGRALAGERVGPIESQRQRADGSLVDVTFTLAPLRDGAGEVVATVAITHDFTGPKRVREALRRANEDLEARVASRTSELSTLNARLTQNLIKLERAEQALRLQAAAFEEQARLLELAHDAIVVRSLPFGTIQFWNPSAAAIYGWSGDEAIGQEAHALLATRFPQPPEEIERRLFAVGHWEGVLEQRRRDGSPIAVECRWAVRRDEQGTPVAILEINRDATERQRIEREQRELYLVLQEHARRVEELAQLKDDFSSIVAHELVTPVAAIRWFVEMLELGGLAPDEIAHALATIKSETDLLHLLVDDVRAIAKIDRDDYAVGPKPVALAEILDSAATFAGSLPGNHPFELRAETGGEVLADRARIGQVLRNLLGNAAKYTPPGTPIVLRASETVDGVLIEVADEGPGIAAEDIEVIFEKYRRGRQPTGRQVAGAGVGLYVSRRIVQAHGSDLSLRSAPGAGATFGFVLRRPE